ncbi:hypothetical protein PENTCL1PPCAC_14304 [Pristionchus entomophagus]|uniref:Sodium/calcium exchanger membrane region domain-containing protein n=1 Tax=Pristionchus entomophagus TaxID=358040 RepID=A0AAV5TE12_9BILA|nr:hypothetical protein PENTCL1PPCAC_14304 [Pristionchus entomophagus]
MISFFTYFVGNDSEGDDDDNLYCKPDPSWNFTDTCNYIQDTAACGAGGYLQWATFVFCCEDRVDKWFIVAGGVLFLLLMFMMLQSSADDFFSPNLSIVVANLNMSESVAGVTFLAFGNGAPDIFGAIASVLSSPQPKADLALGGLIGGAIFVTLVVHAAVILTTPFKCSIWSTLRDLCFFVVTATLILCFFLFFDQIEIWQPLTFLCIYLIYVTTVFISEHFKKKMKANKKEEDGITISRRSSVIPAISIIDEQGDNESIRKGSVIRRRSTAHHHNETEDQDGLVVLHNKVYHRDTLRSRTETLRRSVAVSKDGVLTRFFAFLAADYGENEEPSTAFKIKTWIFWPLVTLFKLTIPLADAPWSKLLAGIHAVLVPQCILFNTQFLLFVPIEGGPGLYAYAPILSVLLIGLILCVTSNDEPRFYKPIYSALGFLSSVVWIYFISSEVVDVVNMLGIVSGINQAVLGLTLIAWANSISDLVADVAVARQGFPRMAVAATIAGPLFNLLIGFGLPFTIAKLQGDVVQISLNGVNLIMITFLFISIIFTMITVIVFRGHLNRAYAALLVVIYVAFLILIILSEMGILVWI